MPKCSASQVSTVPFALGSRLDLVHRGQKKLRSFQLCQVLENWRLSWWVWDLKSMMLPRWTAKCQTAYICILWLCHATNLQFHFQAIQMDRADCLLKMAIHDPGLHNENGMTPSMLDLHWNRWLAIQGPLRCSWKRRWTWLCPATHKKCSGNPFWWGHIATEMITKLSTSRMVHALQAFVSRVFSKKVAILMIEQL